MRKLLLLLMLTISIFSHADSGDEAMKKALEAFAQTENGKTMTKNIERIVNNSLPVEKETAAFIGSAAATVAQGKLDTRPIKNMDVEMLGGKVRPDAEYNIKEKKSSITLQYNLDF